MSATAELLLEQINKLTEELNVAADKGENVDPYREKLKELYKKLSKANSALNEGTNILKG